MTADPLQRFPYPNEETRDLFGAIQRLDTIEDLENFFRDLCTIQELKLMTERWSIAKLLLQRYPYRVVTKKTGASSTTIARVAHWVKYGTGGYEKATQLRANDR